MKILFVVEHFYPYVGGAEELFLNLAVSLAAAGHEVEVVTTLYDHSLPKYEEFRGIKISRVRCYNRFLFTVMSLPAVIRKARKADLIHTTSYNSAIPAFIAGKMLGKKVVITFHEVWEKLWFRLPFTSKLKLAIFYFYEWFILKLPFQKYIAVSEFTRDSLIAHGIPKEKVVQIYNGMDYDSLAAFRHRPPEKFTFCFFGRLGISKGIDLLLDATRIFVSRHPDTTLKLIIPTYPESLFAKVMNSIHQHRLGNNIELMHNLSRQNLLNEVATSSCVVIPSQSEGFCFVAVESVALDVPVISSGKGSLPEVVSGRYLVLPELTAAAIVDALEKAKRNEWKKKERRTFPLQQSVHAYLNLYESLRKK